MRMLLAAVLALAPAALAAQPSTSTHPSAWRVMWEPAVESALVAGLDTATTEGGWCLDADTLTASREVLIRAALPPWKLRSYADSAGFSCPVGMAVAHRHLLDHDHVDGPTEADLFALGTWINDGGKPRWIKIYPFGVVVVRPRAGRPRLKVYGLPQ